MAIKLSDLKKVEATSAGRRAAVPAQTPVTVIVRVERENYVPEGLHVRTRIDRLMFTAAAPMAIIERLERDPLVKSVAFPKTIEPV